MIGYPAIIKILSLNMFIVNNHQSNIECKIKKCVEKK